MLNEDVLLGLIKRTTLNMTLKTEYDPYHVPRYSLLQDEKCLCTSYNEYVLQGFIEGILFVQEKNNGN